MARMWLLLGAINGLLSVAAGAFGAHGLRTKLSDQMLDVFETAARYQMYHALALVAVGWLAGQASAATAHAAGWCFLAGILLFSGSLYALAITGYTKLGMITPIGGTLFLAGWALLAATALRLK